MRNFAQLFFAICFVSVVVAESIKIIGDNPEDDVNVNPTEHAGCYKKCFPEDRHDYLKAKCYYGVMRCELSGTFHYPKFGFSCMCPSKSPSPSATPSSTASPSASVSSSPKPKCPGYIFTTCFPKFKKDFLIDKCPYGVEDCYVKKGKSIYAGYTCKCVIPLTPSPSAKPKCSGRLFEKCFRNKYALKGKCEDGISECHIETRRFKIVGYQCKCVIAKPSNSPQPPKPSVIDCPTKMKIISKSRTMKYDIDLKKSSGCFMVDYSYYKPYTIFVFHEGKTLLKDRVNFAPKKPVSLCYSGYSSIVTVQINTGLNNKIFFSVKCPYKKYY